MIRGLLWLAVLSAGLYIAYRYAEPQIRAWRFKDAMTQTVRLSEGAGEDEMTQALLATADDLGVPLSPRRLRVRRDRSGHARITASWEEIVKLDAWKMGGWVDTLHFAYEVGPSTSERGR